VRQTLVTRFVVATAVVAGVAAVAFSLLANAV
jgi:hypothetical protein